VIQFSRAALIDGVLPSPTAHACLAVEAALALLVGVLLFRWYSPRAAEYL
jgi:hypothetical protein